MSSGSEAEDATLKSSAECRWGGCGEKFSDLTVLVLHITEVHVGKKKNQYACRWEGCPRKGIVQTSRFALISHLRGHTGERPFDCPVPESDALAKHHKCQHADQGPFLEFGNGQGAPDSSQDKANKTNSRKSFPTSSIRSLLNNVSDDEQSPEVAELLKEYPDLCMRDKYALYRNKVRVATETRNNLAKEYEKVRRRIRLWRKERNDLVVQLANKAKYRE